eukprot:CAMPEP_0168331110 /NCGR_PEP_ID=MMETSP0213-20121227/8138_1 /TAXON_ID=151035 /ORGANISM="Euplotes harpa, Strain FSP1.4" /LENGTH=225 /DNA_ID=CAMNT_0008334823 /DNA_START=775 /DNA_END=1449 /DNA_ORIENTATION=+
MIPNNTSVEKTKRLDENKRFLPLPNPLRKNEGLTERDSNNNSFRTIFELVNQSKTHRENEDLPNYSIEKAKKSVNASCYSKKLKAISVRTRSNPIDKLLKSIEQKKQEIKKEIIKNKQLDRENRRIEKKFQELARRKHHDDVHHDLGFIERIKMQDELIGGNSLIENFSKINSRIDNLKMKGFRLIVQYEESKRQAMKEQKAKEINADLNDEIIEESGLQTNNDL